MSTNAPYASVIMPAYNRAYIMESAINSVLAQTYPNWELIIVDDGSTDETESLINGMHDERIIYYKQKNQGPSAARNTGVLLAKGEWIIYLDSDDILYPNYLETMKKQLAAHPKTVFAVPRADRILELYKNGVLLKSIDNSSDLPEHVTIKDIFMKTFHFSCDGFMHKRDIFDTIIHWDEGLRHMEEWDLAMFIGEKYPDGFLYVPIVLCSYRQRHGADGVASNTSYLEWAKAFQYIYEKHRKDHMLKDQTWYPGRVQKWEKINADYQKGLMPPPHLYHFPEYFQPSQNFAVAVEQDGSPASQ